MSVFMRGIVVVTFLAIFAMLFGVMELAARLYVVHGLKIAEQDFTNFYRFDPDLRLLTSGGPPPSPSVFRLRQLENGRT
jgi:hypothetical protein